MVTGTTAAASASTSEAVSGTATTAAEGSSGVVTGTEREMNE